MMFWRRKQKPPQEKAEELAKVDQANRKARREFQKARKNLERLIGDLQRG